MLGDTVLTIGLEKTTDNICVVPVCPYAGFWDVLCKVLFDGDDGAGLAGRPCASLVSVPEDRSIHRIVCRGLRPPSSPISLEDGRERTRYCRLSAALRQRV